MHKIIIYTNYNIGDIMVIYMSIFISKILENTLATLRIIVVSNGKKKLGAILQGVVTLLWLLITGIVIVDINKDIFKIFFFCMGCIVGSYLGSLIEEKIAMGTNTTLAIIDNKYKDKILNSLNKYKINIINSNQINTIIMLITPRKKTISINNKIHNIDNNSIITNLRSKIIYKNSIF